MNELSSLQSIPLRVLICPNQNHSCGLAHMVRVTFSCLNTDGDDPGLCGLAAVRISCSCAP